MKIEFDSCVPVYFQYAPKKASALTVASFLSFTLMVVALIGALGNVGIFTAASGWPTAVASLALLVVVLRYFKQCTIYNPAHLTQLLRYGGTYGGTKEQCLEIASRLGRSINEPINGQTTVKCFASNHPEWIMDVAFANSKDLDAASKKIVQQTLDSTLDSDTPDELRVAIRHGFFREHEERIWFIAKVLKNYDAHAQAYLILVREAVSDPNYAVVQDPNRDPFLFRFSNEFRGELSCFSEFMTILINSGKYALDAKDGRGNTAMDYAIATFNEGMIDVLRAKGVSFSAYALFEFLEISDADGKKAHRWACMSGVVVPAPNIFQKYEAEAMRELLSAITDATTCLVADVRNIVFSYISFARPFVAFQAKENERAHVEEQRAFGEKMSNHIVNVCVTQ